MAELHIIVNRQFTLCLRMIHNLIDESPDSIWEKKAGGHIYWQQILHALTGSLFWLRLHSGSFCDPFEGKRVYPELDKDPEEHLTKKDLMTLYSQVEQKTNHYFSALDSEKLLMPSELYSEITVLDVIFMQIRHIQYHIGHCDALLREHGFAPAEWIDYFGE